jgi:hypothetical protein
LTLSVSTTKGQYRPLEPIPVVLTLANRTEHVINGHSALDFGYNYVELYVGPRQGEMKNIGPLSMVSIYLAAKRREMKPGAEFSAKELLNLRLDQIFPEPGTYLIEARVFDLDRKESVISKPLAVRVLPAKGVDHQALEFIDASENPKSTVTFLNR